MIIISINIKTNESKTEKNVLKDVFLLKNCPLKFGFEHKRMPINHNYSH